MRKKIRNSLKMLYGSELELNNRLFNIIMSGCFMTSILSIIGSVLSNNSLSNVLLVMMIAIIIVILIWISNTYNKADICALIGGIIVDLFMLPVLYFTGGGLYSGMSSWFIFGMVYCFLLYKGKRFFIMTTLTGLSFTGCLVISYFKPETVISMESEFSVYLDTHMGMILTAISVGTLIKFQRSIFEQEQKKSEERQVMLQEANATKDRFLANMSHEIRTPINTIIGLNEMNLREQISEEVEENSVNIQRASGMLLSLINDVLDMSKIGAGKMEIIPRNYDFGGLLSDLINISWLRAHEKKLEFNLDISPNIPAMLYGDDIRIRQVVTNILTNAIKYTQKGSVTLLADGEILDNNRIRLKISVKDTGIGIRAEDIPHLFDSFQRLDERNNKGIEGTGLGLAISYQFVEMMGGEILVDSSYQRGSVFSVVIEQGIVDKTPMGAVGKVLKSSAGNRKKYHQTFEAPDAKVLVVDDNEMNRMVAVKLLRGTRVQVDTAASGEECLEKTKSHYYHTIFMDHLMPEMDGIETLSRIRKQENGMCKDTPVIALTANVVSGADKFYRKRGFDGYLMKPINGTLFEAMLADCLPENLIEVRVNDIAEEDAEVRLLHRKAKRPLYISTESVADLSENILKQYDINSISYYIITEEGRFRDKIEISSDNLNECLKKPGNEVTSEPPSVEEYERFFADALEKAEQVLHISLASSSGRGYERALKASKGFSNVYVIDAGFVSSGMGTLVMIAADMAKKGHPIEEIQEAVEKAKSRIAFQYVIATTDVMHYRGFLDKYQKFFLDFFNLKPVLSLKKGEMYCSGLHTGNMTHVYKCFVRRCLKGKRNVDKRVMFLSYAGCTSRQLEMLKEEIKKYQDFDVIIEEPISATITSNCGLGTIGIAFMKKE